MAGLWILVMLLLRSGNSLNGSVVQAMDSDPADWGFDSCRNLGDVRNSIQPKLLLQKKSYFTEDGHFRVLERWNARQAVLVFNCIPFIVLEPCLFTCSFQLNCLLICTMSLYCTELLCAYILYITCKGKWLSLTCSRLLLQSSLIIIWLFAWSPSGDYNCGRECRWIL